MDHLMDKSRSAKALRVYQRQTQTSPGVFSLGLWCKLGKITILSAFDTALRNGMGTEFQHPAIVSAGSFVPSIKEGRGGIDHCLKKTTCISYVKPTLSAQKISIRESRLNLSDARNTSYWCVGGNIKMSVSSLSPSAPSAAVERGSGKRRREISAPPHSKWDSVLLLHVEGGTRNTNKESNLRMNFFRKEEN